MTWKGCTGLLSQQLVAVVVLTSGPYVDRSKYLVCAYSVATGLRGDVVENGAVTRASPVKFLCWIRIA